jgi:hypothetical protein
MNKRNVNLLHTVPKQEIMNSKNLHVVTCSRAGEDIYPEPTSRQRRDRIYTRSISTRQIDAGSDEIFQNIDQDKTNKGEHANIFDTTLENFYSC